MRPFRQIRFDALPEHPRLPHAWAKVTRWEGVVGTTATGPVDTVWFTYGQGPPLLLVHGLMTHAFSFQYVLDLLGAHYTLVMPDLPGAGASSKPATGYAPDELADWLKAFMVVAGIEGAAVIGNSLGGYLSLRLALRHPAAVRCLVDLHSPGVPLLRLWALHAAMRTPGADQLLHWLVSRGPARWCHRMTHYYDETLKSREEANIWAEPLRTAAGIAAFGHYLRTTMDARAIGAFTQDLAARRDQNLPFPVPLRLLYATTDPIVPPLVGHELGGLIPSATLRFLDQASHFAHVDAPERFVAAVLPFLAAHHEARPEEVPPVAR